MLSTGERLGPMDATLLYLETPTSSSNVGLVCRFDGPIPFDEFVEDFKRRRLHRLPRFHQLVAPVPFNLSFPTWEDDPNFVPDHHIHLVELEPPGSEPQLEDVIDDVMGRRVDLRRPPWDLTVVNGLADKSSIVLIHMHHCLSDGVGVTKVFNALFEPNPVPLNVDIPEAELPQAQPLPGPFARLAGAARDWRTRRQGRKAGPAKAPDELARRKAEDKERWKAFGKTMKEFMQTPGIRLPFNAPLSGRLHHGFASFELDALRLIKDRIGGTINDVLLTILAGAIDRLAGKLGIPVDGAYLRVYQAANTRSTDESGDWGNRLAFMPASVPLGLADPADCLRQTAAYTKRTKELGVREVADSVVRAFQTKIPPPLAKLGLRLMLAPSFERLTALGGRPPGFNVYLTNVRFPDFDAFIGGQRLTEISGLAPLVPNTGVTCAAVSYRGRLCIGITADLETLPDVDGFGAMLCEAFEHLLAASEGMGDVDGPQDQMTPRPGLTRRAVREPGEDDTDDTSPR